MTERARRGRSWLIKAIPRITRGRLIGAFTTMLLLGAAITWVNWDSGEEVRAEPAMVTVRSGPDRDEPVNLDTTVYLPESATEDTPAPALLLAHGFGGTKNSVDASARELAGRGYVVLAWSARGFGRSGGTISLNDPDYEINDARALVDELAKRNDVRRDSPGDPRIGVVGGSYGGALALMLAGYDSRVDAVVPQITWHNLADAFFPESTGAGADAGVFKRQWAGLFFGSGSGLTAETLLGRGAPVKQANVQCGRFSQAVCDLYLDAAADGTATPGAIALLERNSPKGVLTDVKAPTLLVQGQADSLFPLSEADANAKAIAATGTPVRVAWYAGGHDDPGRDDDIDRTKFLTVQWLDHYLKGEGAEPSGSFTYNTAGGISARSSRATTLVFSTDDYPGLRGEKLRDITLSGATQKIANPPGGTPAAISSLAGVGGGSGGLLSGLSLEIPGQNASFDSEPFDAAVDVVGAASAKITVSGPKDAVVFAKLYDVAEDGRATLPRSLVAPVRISEAGEPVTVTLPAIAHRFEAGHRARLVIATSDQAYSTPAAPAVYEVALADRTLTLPQVKASAVAGLSGIWPWVLLALVVLIALAVAVTVIVVRLRHRRIDRAVRADAADTPLVIENLRKAYGDGYLAVKNLSFRVEREQVVGLLGPNGAGKTTTLRMLMGLIKPSDGEILVFGHRISAGAPVLSRLGAFVEGSGFLPHLTGAQNLKQYWAATGRPQQDARVAEALQIAGLGAAIDRKVKAYSQGMRQRLAIAQAMLGLPDLLVLDEPTNGLDPPQIREMREVLRRYATGGRTVLVSSHLLAEVEQVCSHVVVMHKGELVASGPVEDIVGESTSVQIEVVGDVDVAVKALKNLDGVTTVEADGNAVVADLDGVERSEVVRVLVGAGVGVERFAPRRRLEDVFLSLVGEQ